MTDFHLDPDPSFPGTAGPLVLVILDGVGLFAGRSDGYDANAFDLAETPNLDRLLRDAPVSLELIAHGKAVGMPSDADMGNSEVGHNAIGAGRIFEQGAALVNAAIASGAIFRGPAWQELIANVRQQGSTLHLIGLLSDGNVHSHIDHVAALIRQVTADGIGRLRVHPLADGRDVDPVTFHLYLDQLEAMLVEARAGGVDAQVASGGGRMAITMDRYNANWGMVRRGWETHVLGRGRGFGSAGEAVATLRAESPGVIDQDLPPFVVLDAAGAPVGPILDGDSVIFFNFRGDRAIEISRAFTEPGLDSFDRGYRPEVLYAGMMEYDGDLRIPARFLVTPPAISCTISEYLVHNGVSQLAVAETQKFGHVTYFWNGNNSEPFDAAMEEWVEVPSDDVPFEHAPAMKAREVCQVVIDSLSSRRHRFLRVNFANPDMVGHTGVLPAAVLAMEVVDQSVGRLEEAVQDAGGTMIVTADHGNLEMMWEVVGATGKVKLDLNGTPVVKTSHTLNPVPWLLAGADAALFEPNPELNAPGLGNIAATILLLLGFKAPKDYLPALIRRRARKAAD